MATVNKENPRSPAIAKDLSEKLSGLFTEVARFFQDPSPKSSTGFRSSRAQDLFSRVIIIATDPFANDCDSNQASDLASGLYPWVVLPNTDHPNYGRFSVEHSILDEVELGDYSAYESKTARLRNR